METANYKILFRFHNSNLQATVATEPQGSTPLIAKPIIRHDHASSTHIISLIHIIINYFHQCANSLLQANKLETYQEILYEIFCVLHIGKCLVGASFLDWHLTGYCVKVL
jgi:hypothetical protein